MSMHQKERALFALNHSDQFGRMAISTMQDTEWVELRQTHRNGSNKIVGEITLDNLSELQNLHFGLGKLLDYIAAHPRTQ